jgi:hypothetical protein
MTWMNRQDMEEPTRHYRIGKFWSTERMPKKSQKRLEEISDFYTDDIIEEMLYPLAVQQLDVSSRALEHFCVNYSKKFNVAYQWNIDGEIILVNVFQQYKNWLAHYKRINFDFFRRYTRVYFEHKDLVLETTVGQMNLMYWAYKFGVLDYARRNLDLISEDMSETHGNNRKDILQYKLAGKRRKRQKLARDPTSICVIYEVPVCVKFNDVDSDPSERHGAGRQDPESAIRSAPVADPREGQKRMKFENPIPSLPVPRTPPEPECCV